MAIIVAKPLVKDANKYIHVCFYERGACMSPRLFQEPRHVGQVWRVQRTEVMSPELLVSEPLYWQAQQMRFIHLLSIVHRPINENSKEKKRKEI